MASWRSLPRAVTQRSRLASNWIVVLGAFNVMVTLALGSAVLFGGIG